MDNTLKWMDYTKQLRASALPAEQWELHKHEILREYERGGLSHMRKFMSEQHAFNATESQYRYRLYKLWGQGRKSKSTSRPSLATDAELGADVADILPLQPQSAQSLKDESSPSRASASIPAFDNQDKQDSESLGSYSSFKKFLDFSSYRDSILHRAPSGTIDPQLLSMQHMSLSEDSETRAGDEYADMQAKLDHMDFSVEENSDPTDLSRLSTINANSSSDQDLRHTLNQLEPGLSTHPPALEQSHPEDASPGLVYSASKKPLRRSNIMSLLDDGDVDNDAYVVSESGRRYKEEPGFQPVSYYEGLSHADFRDKHEALLSKDAFSRATRLPQPKDAGGSIQSHSLEQTDSGEPPATARGTIDLDRATQGVARSKIDSGYQSGPLAPTQSKDTSLIHNMNSIAESPSVRTQYSASVVSGIAESRDAEYISFIASELGKVLATISLDKLILQAILKEVPFILKSFALRHASSTSSQENYDVAFFIHRHRLKVVAPFREFCKDNLLDDVDHEPESPRLTDFALKRFLDDNGTQHEAPVSDLPFYSGEPLLQDQGELEYDDSSSDDTFEDDPITLESAAYTSLFRNSPAFQWLLDSIHKAATSTVEGHNAMSAISAQISNVLPADVRMSRRSKPSLVRLELTFDWDVQQFWTQQNYVEPLPEALMHAITLTGNSRNAQAATTKDYVNQTWPVLGKRLLETICDPANTISASNACCGINELNFIDGRTSARSLSGSSCFVEAVGTIDALIEVVQLFAWISAALGGYQNAHLVCRTPRIGHVNYSTISSRVLGPTPPGIAPAVLRCSVTYDERWTPRTPDVNPGECWFDMLRNPVLVEGYPILRRAAINTGIEMPIEMMAILVDAQRAQSFAGQLFLKGFSAMLMVADIVQDTVIWHYLFNPHAKHISYLDGLTLVNNGVDLAEHCHLSMLDSKRHIVGWCTDHSYHIGAKDAPFDIGGTGLPLPSKGAILEKVTISAGKLVTIGATIAVGVRDRPNHVSRRAYSQKLEWLDEKFLVLWDDEEKRGWLANGNAALAHLIHAKLHFSKNGRNGRRNKFAMEMTLKLEDLKEPKDYTAATAVDFLLDDDNRTLVVYPEKHELVEERESKGLNDEKLLVPAVFKKRQHFMLFENLVEEYYETLEKLIEYQRSAAGENAVRLKARTRKHLEGWDFVDIAIGRDADPRVAKLDAAGWGWVDFVRSIGAVVLHGCGFGELIQPGDSQFICDKWQTLPKGKSYLAATAYDLETIMDVHGNPRGRPKETVRGLVWHYPGAPGSLTAPCSRCKQKSILSRHTDPVQIFYPKAFGHNVCYAAPCKLTKNMAFAFGHSINWGYRWPVDGADINLMAAHEAEVDNLATDQSQTPSTTSGATSDVRRYQGSSLTPVSHLAISTPPTTISRDPSHDAQLAIPTYIRTQEDDDELPAPTAVIGEAPMNIAAMIDGWQERPLRSEKRKLGSDGGVPIPLHKRR